MSDPARKRSLLQATMLAAGNMIGTRIFLLPVPLASVGGIAVFGWLVASVGAAALGFVFAKMGELDPQEGGPYGHARDFLGPYAGFQTNYIYCQVAHRRHGDGDVLDPVAEPWSPFRRSALHQAGARCGPARLSNSASRGRRALLTHSSSCNQQADDWLAPTAGLIRRFVARRLLVGLSVPFLSLASLPAQGQPAREIHEQSQFWWSINSTSRLTDRWGVVGDFHIRRNDFVQDPSFYFLRFGAHCWLSSALTVTLGYAHNWVAPAVDGGETWTEENRIYQQVQYAGKLGKVRVLQRLRNEQRWQEEAEDDVLTGTNKFTDRIRCLFSLTIPVAQSRPIPALVVSDELLVQFGPEVVMNTFEQNRLFVGIKEELSRAWSFDFGYMLVYQQKSSGYEYDLNHTLRWFFYATPDFRKVKSAHEPAGSEE